MLYTITHVDNERRLTTAYYACGSTLLRGLYSVVIIKELFRIDVCGFLQPILRKDTIGNKKAFQMTLIHVKCVEVSVWACRSEWRYSPYYVLTKEMADT